MEFENLAQQESYEKAARWLREIFGEFVKVKEERPVILVPKGSTFSVVNVMPWGKEGAIIKSSAIVVKGADLKPDLMKYLLSENYTKAFGGFSLDGEGDIWFGHTIFGPTCDKEELRHSVMMVLHTADKLDDEIVSRWGGTRAMDD